MSSLYVKLLLGGSIFAAMLTYHFVALDNAKKDGIVECQSAYAEAQRKADERADKVDDRIAEGEDKVVEVVRVETVEVVKVDTRAAAENEANKRRVAELEKELERRDEQPSYEVTMCDPVQLPASRVRFHTQIDKLLQDVR